MPINKDISLRKGVRIIVVDWLGWRYQESFAPEAVCEDEVDQLVERLITHIHGKNAGGHSTDEDRI